MDSVRIRLDADGFCKDSDGFYCFNIITVLRQYNCSATTTLIWCTTAALLQYCCNRSTVLLLYYNSIGVFSVGFSFAFVLFSPPLISLFPHIPLGWWGPRGMGWTQETEQSEGREVWGAGGLCGC